MDTARGRRQSQTLVCPLGAAGDTDDDYGAFPVIDLVDDSVGACPEALKGGILNDLDARRVRVFGEGIDGLLEASVIALGKAIEGL